MYGNSRQGKRALNTNSKAWKLLRQQVLVRDGYQCQVCKRLVTGKEAHVDHKANDAHLPESNTLGRLWLLCAKCHGAKTRAEMDGREWSGRAGPQRVGLDGWPVED